MKKSLVLILVSFLVITTYSNNNESTGKLSESKSVEKTAIDHPIVGKWEYLKTIRTDGSEVINLIATEHFYSDGSILFVNVWLKPQPLNVFRNTPENIKSNLNSTIGAIGTYTIEKENDKNRLTYNIVNSTRMNDMGKSNSVDIKVDGNTLIYYLDNGDQLIMKRIKDK